MGVTLSGPMGSEDSPLCPRHPDEVRMQLQTLHSDQLAPTELLGVYACPECDYERRLPFELDGEGARS